MNRMKTSWIVIITFAIAIGFVSAMPTIYLHIQQMGVYTPDRVVYTFIAQETNGISISSYVFPVVLNTSYPLYSFAQHHPIMICKDPVCSSPMKYWVQTQGQNRIVIWVYLPTITSSQSFTFYICASTTNLYPSSGDPEINHMFMKFDDFRGNGYINWSSYSPAIVGAAITPTTTVENGTLTMINTLGTGTEAALDAGTVDIANTPYFIVLAKISVPNNSGLGVVGGVYMTMNGYWAEMYVGNMYVEYTDTSYNGFYMFFSSSDLWGPTYTYPQYYSTSKLDDWAIIAEWNFYGNYPDVYPALYNGEMSLITYTSASLYYTATSPHIGIIQLRWNDSVGQQVAETLYVDWFAVIQYWGFPSLSYVGATVHEVKK